MAAVIVRHYKNTASLAAVIPQGPNSSSRSAFLGDCAQVCSLSKAAWWEMS